MSNEEKILLVALVSIVASFFIIFFTTGKVSISHLTLIILLVIAIVK